jgi:hypothetical protein
MLLGRELPACDISTLKVGRCARHSKFPECTKCQVLRKAWHKATQKSSTHPSVVQEAYEAMLAHRNEWSADREEALRLRQSCYNTDAEGCYECDDKCGSFWQELPVDETGRSSKADAARVFKFSVQCNMICGKGW